MNYDIMTDEELLNYLDVYSDDPLIRRIVRILSRTRGALLNDLENAGMDRVTWQFETDWQHLYPGDYIIHLRNELNALDRDAEELRQQLYESERERDDLKTRSIMDFVQEVWQEKKTASYIVSEAQAEAKAQRKENDRLKEQIDMWGKMNQVKVGAG